MNSRWISANGFEPGMVIISSSDKSRESLSRVLFHATLAFNPHVCYSVRLAWQMGSPFNRPGVPCYHSLLASYHTREIQHPGKHKSRLVTYGYVSHIAWQTTGRLLTMTVCKEICHILLMRTRLSRLYPL